MDQGLEPAGMLESIGQRVTHEGNMIALFEGEFGALLGL